MSFKRYSRTIVIVILVFMIWPATMSSAADNLLKNASFEQVTAGSPDAWGHEEWSKDDGLSDFYVEREVAQSGSNSVAIHNVTADHARWTQTIEVKAKSIYRFSGYVLAEGINEDATGAHLFVEGVAVSYPQVKNTNQQWEYIEFYGKTSKKQTEITVGASLGGYGSVNIGQAFFDDLKVEKVSKAPAGTEVFSLAITSVSDAAAEASKPVSIISFLLYAMMFTILFGVIYNKVIRDRNWLDQRKAMYPFIFAAVFLVALALRIWIAVSNKGYVNDIALFMAWADHAVKNGISGFYNTDMFVDYPPGYIYILYVLGSIKNMLALDSSSAQALLLFKMPAIMADLAAAAYLFVIARKKVSYSVSIGLATIYLFNPAVIVDSAAWGQVDAVFAFALILAIYGISEKRFRSASIWYAIAALIKPQAFIFMPVLLIALFYRRDWKQVALSAFYGFSTFILLALPFFGGEGGLKTLISLYKGTLSSYPYATLNAFNIYALSNANWKALEESWLFLTFQTWGTIFIFVAVALAIYFSLRKRNSSGSDRSFFIAMILISIVFLFVTKMHERYMFPILLLSLFAFIQTLDRRMLYVFFGFSLTNFVNIVYVLAHSQTTTRLPMDGVLIVGSTANIALLLYMLYIGYDIYKKGSIKEVVYISEDVRSDADQLALQPFKMDSMENVKQKDKRLERKDWLWMGAITLLYAIVALSNLGAHNGPETAWQPSTSGQSFYVDLGENKQIERINNFGGVGTGKFTYEFSNDATNWENKIDVENGHTAVFTWNIQNTAVNARYIKLTVETSGFSMHELAVYEQGSEAPLPIAAVHDGLALEAKRGSVQLLFDEQSKAEYKATYMNGSYFDEIYHARTAYEHIEHIVAYENTHPPLGKIIIALGIKLFGLNPFGWRIAGTIFGIFMLPIMYLFARSLFKKRNYAILATSLFAVDFMHFTQTRISTIDVYGVFFIMLMFYFMHKYQSLSFYRVKLGATLMPLFLAGLFFGIGVASKWIVLYGGAGLAIMLALSLFDRYKEYAAARRVLSRGSDQEQLFNKEKLLHIVKVFPRNTLITLASCLIFYIAIPLIIYALSYIPVLTVMDEGYTVKSLVDYQKHMFSYHSKLVSTHPFASTWWEWPFMKRPVWYYSGDAMPAGQASTIVAMGNPLIWWTGIIAMLLTIWVSIKRKDKSMYILWIAFFAQYVPWMLVTRLTYLYHYFAMVPFIILSLVYMFKVIEEKKPGFVKIRYLYLAFAVLLFVLFYPALSGLPVQKWYVLYVLRWFPSWLF